MLSKSKLSVLILIVLPFCGCASVSTGNPSHSKALSHEEIANIVSSPNRSPEDKEADTRRKPIELLTFIGIHPGITALDLSSGGGYTTELITRAIGPSGHVYGQSPPVVKQVAPPQHGRNETLKSESIPVPSVASPKVRLSSPDALNKRIDQTGLKNITPLILPFSNPIPPELANAHLDLVTFIYNYHDLAHQDVDRIAMNTHIYDALKPGGLYIIADHSGRQGTGISESATLHRIEEKFLIDEVTAAGFKLQARGDFLQNLGDPRTENTLASGQLKDGFILKFIKPASIKP